MFNFIFSLMLLLSILHINIIIVDLKSNCTESINKNAITVFSVQTYTCFEIDTPYAHFIFRTLLCWIIFQVRTGALVAIVVTLPERETPVVLSQPSLLLAHRRRNEYQFSFSPSVTVYNCHSAIGMVRSVKLGRLNITSDICVFMFKL